MSTLNRFSPLASAPPDACDLAWGCCRPDESGDGLAGTCRLPADAPPMDSRGWFRLALGLFVAAQTMLFGLSINLTPPEEPAIRLALQWAMLLATLAVFGLLGLPMVSDALKQIRQKRVTMEMFFVVGVSASIALSGYSMARGQGPVYFEVAATLLIVYTIGRAISGRSRRQALSAIGHWVASLSLARLVCTNDPKAVKVVPVSEVRLGDLVQVLPGELIPVDGRIEQGQAFISETAFTGQWLACRKGPGDRVIAATANQDGLLLIRAQSDGASRQMDHLADIIRQAQRQPSQLQRSADRFVAWFLPLVLLASLATLSYWTWAQSIHQGIHAALAVLMIACPCAAGLAAPLAVWNVMGRLAGQGFIVRHGDAVEQLAQADSVIFDKTGTLGSEQLLLKKVHLLTLPPELSPDDLLGAIVAVESMSTHPVAQAIRGQLNRQATSGVQVQSVQTLPGRGLMACITLQGRQQHLMLTRDESADAGSSDLLTILATLDDQPVARLELHETLRGGAEATVAQLKQMGLAVTIMTGDAASAQARLAHLAQASTNMTPQAKHQAVIELRQTNRQFSKPVFVGDGLNDAAAMAASHSSLAMAHGSAVAIDSASSILINNDLTLLPQAISMSRQAMQVAKSNLAWAVAYNLIGITAAATGHLHPILAALLMSASSMWVSWRSFHATDFRSAGLPKASVQSAAAQQAVTPHVTLFTMLHWLGWLGQGWLLAMILGGSAMTILLSLAAFAAIGWVSLRWWPKYPHWADMTLAMLTLGGLGMNLGWWADLGFAAAPVRHACCIQADGSIHLMTWMNGGMLLLGVPAMFLVRYRPEPFNWRRWCCTGMLLLGVPGMVAGMMAGSALTRLWFAHWPHTAYTLIHFLLMTVGMVVGMLIPHFLEYALPRRWRSDPQAL